MNSEYDTGSRLNDVHCLDKNQYEAAFSGSALFAGLMPEARSERFIEGESLSAFADAEQCVGLMVQGSADVWCFASDGTETLLNTIAPGDCFGIAYLYGDTGMQTRVIARERCEAAFVRKTDVQALLSGDPEFAVRYYALCNRKLQFLLGRIALLTSQSCRTRLAAYLLLNRDSDGFIPLTGSKDELARRLSVSRAAVYRELNALADSGAITVAKRGIILNDPEALEQKMYNDDKKESVSK